MAKVHPAVAAVQKSGAQKVKVAVSDIDGVKSGCTQVRNDCGA